ncbi:MAG: hypothetical protein OXP71_08735 [Candidatus Poribacteria bacterium]|nr:hypothetical protein [Candidatus Poribacteria bacterium]
MTDKLRYLLMYEQHMLFVAHKTQYMSNKWICGAQMHNKLDCWTQIGKNVLQLFIGHRCPTNLFAGHETENMTDNSRYLPMYEQQITFVAHKTQYMSSKSLCC